MLERFKSMHFEFFLKGGGEVEVETEFESSGNYNKLSKVRYNNNQRPQACRYRVTTLDERMP